MTSGLPRVTLVERDLAADGRNADAVAIARDAGDNARERAADERIIERPEPERVEQGDRTRAHREDVADDAADAGRRALVRLDERRVIVRFDLENRGETIADVDGARILPGSLKNSLRRSSAAFSNARASSCSCSVPTT